MTSKGLIVIIVVAALIRAGGLLWGFSLHPPPLPGFHPDEARQVAAAIDFPHDVSWRKDVRYPTLLPYAAGAIAWPVRHAEAVLGFPMSETAAVPWLVARLLSLVCGLGSIWLTFLLAQRMFGARAGLLAAAIVAVAPYPVQLSAWATNDIASSFFLLLATLMVLRLFERRRLCDFMGVGISIGLLLGTRSTGWIAGIFFLWVFSAIEQEEGRKTLGWTEGAKLLVVAGAAAGTFLLTTPATILHPGSLVRSIAFLAEECQRFGLPATDPAAWRAFLTAFTDAFGAPLAVVTGIGLVAGFLSPRPRGLVGIGAMLAAFFAPFVLLGPNLLLPRYVVMILPLLCVIAAGGIVRIAAALPRRARAMADLVVAIAVGASLVMSAWAVSLRWNDPRMEAAVFIEERLPAGTAIGWGRIGDFECWDWTLPRIDSTHFRQVDPLTAPEVVVLSSVCTDRILAALDDPERFFSPPRKGVHPLQAWFPWLRIPGDEVFAFVDDVIREKRRRYRYHLVADFHRNVPVSMEFPPPAIRIYARDDQR